MTKHTIMKRFDIWSSGVQINDLVLNSTKTMEFIVDYRKNVASPLYIHGEELEKVNNIKFLGLNFTNNLTWTVNTHYLV